jgi:hypothetical protein
MAGYLHATVTVGTAATLLGTTGSPGGVLVQNNGSAAVFLGGPTVTADTTATGGLQVAAGASMTVPTVGGAAADLYAIVATGTADVAWLSPA